MGLIDTLRNQLRKTRKATASTEEQEAVIDLLVMTMYADRFIDLSENEVLEQVVSKLGNDSDAPSHLEQYLNTSLAKVRETLNDETEHRALLQDVSERLGNDRMRTFAYEAGWTLACADGELAEEEKRFLRTVQEAFGVSRPSAS